MAKKSGLGRGLGSLISGGAPAPKPGAVREPAASNSSKTMPGTKPGKIKPVPSKAAIGRAVATERLPEAGRPGLQELPVARLVPNPHQPRREFDPESLGELRESIRSEGLLQPVVARAREDGSFELIAGERRWRACKELKMKTIPVRIIEASEVSSAILSLIENLQREDLNPIEEAMGFASLMKDFNLKQDQVAERVGRGRASIANSLRLLNLPKEIQGYLTRGHLSVGHAKVLLSLTTAEAQTEVARRAIEGGWSVRELEKHLSGRDKPTDRLIRKGVAPAAETAAIADVEKRLASALSTPVQLRHRPRKGRIIIEYFGNEDLQRILEQIGVREG
jgi:ParB family chromosome partitioning protein